MEKYEVKERIYIIATTIIGVIANILSIIIVGRKRLQKIGPIIIHKCLFSSNSIYLGIFCRNSFL